MEIKTPENKFQNISYGDPNYEELVNHLSSGINEAGHHLCLFLGMYQPDKKKALKELEDTLNRTVKVINTSELVSKIESETFKNLDNFFAGLDEQDSILYFENGSKLCGAYTGY